MNADIPALLHEIHQTRIRLQREKEELKTEANPVLRAKRSWHQHRTAWLATLGGAAGLLALAVTLRARRKKHVLPPQYVVVSPTPSAPARGGVFASIFKLASNVAKPFVLNWVKDQAEARFARAAAAASSRSST